MKLIPGRFFLAASTLTLAIIAMVTISGTAPATKDSSPEIEKAVLARMNEIKAAAQELNADKVFAFVSDNDSDVIAQNGRVFTTRSNALESTRQNFEALRKAGARIEYRFDHQHVTLLSPTLALVVSEGSTSVSMGNGTVRETQFAQSVLFVLTNGDWKVFHAHRSFVQTPTDK